MGSSPIGLVTQSAENTALTKARDKHDSTQNQNLAQILFFESNIDADLKLVIESWQQLSPELKQAIVKMVQ